MYILKIIIILLLPTRIYAQKPIYILDCLDDNKTITATSTQDNSIFIPYSTKWLYDNRNTYDFRLKLHDIKDLGDDYLEEIVYPEIYIKHKYERISSTYNILNKKLFIYINNTYTETDCLVYEWSESVQDFIYLDIVKIPRKDYD